MAAPDEKLDEFLASRTADTDEVARQFNVDSAVGGGPASTRNSRPDLPPVWMYSAGSGVFVILLLGCLVAAFSGSPIQGNVASVSSLTCCALLCFLFAKTAGPAKILIALCALLSAILWFGSVIGAM